MHRDNRENLLINGKVVMEEKSPMLNRVLLSSPEDEQDYAMPLELLSIA